MIIQDLYRLVYDLCAIINMLMTLILQADDIDLTTATELELQDCPRD